MNLCGVSWFKMDEESGNLIDSKGSNIGTNNGTTVVTGVHRNARSFNGVNSYVQFNAPVIPHGEKSVRFKFKYDEIPSTNVAIIDCGGTSAQRGFLFATTPSGIAFQMSRGTSGTFNFVWTGGHYNNGLFHDFLFTYDGTLAGNSIQIYIDRSLVYEGKPLSLETTAYSNNLTLGRFASVASGYGKGVLDELEIYSEVIKPTLSKFLLSSDDKYSIKDSTVFKMETDSEKNFLNYGADLISNFNGYVTKQKDIKSTNVILGIGKTFEHTIDMSKRRVDKIILG